MGQSRIHGEGSLSDLVSGMVAPHDQLSFDELKNRYNFQKTSCWEQIFLRLLAEEAERVRARMGQVHGLDIGCGVGIARRPHWTAAVRPYFDELIGIEPDPSIKPDPEIIDSFQTASLETATLPVSYFDLAYSFMVVEHVANPGAFLEAIHRALKPGGVHFFVSVNGAHYFARIAKAIRRLGLEDGVLRLVRGKQEIGEYHYPVEYRMNRVSQLNKLAQAHGFEPPEYVFLEEDGPAPYFPGPLKPALKAMMLKRKLIKKPGHLLTMYCRMQKRS
ncbi:MAG: class I SAM-dependent methyltransferase [Phycisphaerales bacterium]|nr:class I SAM-dependent methyltransferase [Phycisphaerales bacterium]